MTEPAYSFGPRESQWPQKSVRDVLLQKGFGVPNLAPTATVLEALEVMESEQAPAVVVTKNGWLVGIFTEKDYATRVVLSDECAASLRMEEVMSTDVVTIDPDSSLDACMTLMANHKVRYLPVLAADRVMGILSLSDVVQAVSQGEREFLSLFPASGAFEKREI